MYLTLKAPFDEFVGSCPPVMAFPFENAVEMHALFLNAMLPHLKA